MFGYLRSVWDCRYFWLSLVRMDLRSRYRGSVLGMGWSLLNPVFMAAILCVAFQAIFKQDPLDFGLYLFAGLTVWNFVRDSTQQGCLSFFQAEGYIRQFPAPMAIYPLRTVLGSSFHFLMALALVFAVRFVLIGFSGMLSFVSLIPTVLMIFVVGWSLAVLAGFVTAYFPDMQHLAEVGLQILFYATPIVYPADRIGGNLGAVLACNPLAAFLEVLRAPVLHGEFPDPSRMALAAVSTAVIVGAATLTLVRLQKKIIFQL